MPDPAIFLETSIKAEPDNNMHKADSMLRQRTKERRLHKEKTRFPLSDSKGGLVLENRRVQPDRRLGNIEAEWVDISIPSVYPE